MADTRVVLVNGARQVGKSTLVSQIAKQSEMSWYSFDSSETLGLAKLDPAEFVRAMPPVVIDEVQRFPEILLAIKELVDFHGEPGMFLLTGSARVQSLRSVPDTLPGRIETIELWPLSQGEIDGASDGFVDAAFAHGASLSHESHETREGYVDRIVRGGFPEAVARTGKRRVVFHRSYVADLVNRDVTQISSIDKTGHLRSLVQLLAVGSGELLVPAALANRLGITAATVNRYVELLEQTFLVKRIPAWSRNLSTRATATPKAAMVDSGIVASLLGMDAVRLRRLGSPLGPLLEGFVAMEVARQLSWCDQDVHMYHYRTRDNVEVDIILENAQGQVIAVEVKAASSTRPEDFRGLKHLAARLGDDFLAGYVLHLGTQSLPAGPKLRTLPVAALWEVPAP
ncbi:MAG: ATP-binding protein [Micrococcales bacterium]|nr:ATP-binding protein [Micrococcales bacterium]MCL2666261.1 ATP-binding protein [Micrococcales bacterium]